uniref:Uncharacterized protein n=1 Tax=Chenopodium quinoa TaxID=63459 RepID=A0A803NEI6_CHEQI
MENGTSKKVETLSGGALVVLEGLDRSGKSSQCSELLSHLKFLGYFMIQLAVLLVTTNVQKAAERGGYGDERYERLDFQGKVREKYKTLYDASWKVVDACLPMEEVQKMLREYVLECVAECQNGKALSHLWLH